MVTIEKLTEAHVETITHLAVALWPDTTHEEMLAHFTDVVADVTATAFLARETTNFVGFIEVSTRTDYVEGAEELPVAYIEGLYVAQRFRKQGVGRLLIAQAERWALENGFTEICSDAELENDRSIAFHQSVGFSEVSRIVCFTKKLTTTSMR